MLKQTSGEILQGMDEVGPSLAPDTPFFFPLFFLHLVVDEAKLGQFVLRNFDLFPHAQVDEERIEHFQAAGMPVKLPLQRYCAEFLPFGNRLDDLTTEAAHVPVLGAQKMPRRGALHLGIVPDQTSARQDKIGLVGAANDLRAVFSVKNDLRARDIFVYLVVFAFLIGQAGPSVKDFGIPSLKFCLAILPGAFPLPFRA